MSIKKYHVINDQAGFQHIGVPFNYSRGIDGPLDNTSHWPSLELAKQYAKGDFKDSAAKKAAGISDDSGNFIPYVGQIITVEEGSSVVTYVIENEAGDLKKVGDNAATVELSAKLYGTAESYTDGDIGQLSAKIKEI